MELRTIISNNKSIKLLKMINLIKLNFNIMRLKNFKSCLKFKCHLNYIFHYNIKNLS